MTSEPAPRSRASGVATALFVLVCVAILTGLGVWQVERLHWKEDLLRRVASAQTASPQPIGPVLERLRQGQDVEWTRVSTDCAPAPPDDFAGEGARYGILDGQVVWRAVIDCRLAGSSYGWIRLDRGSIDAVRGQVSPPHDVRLPRPARVTGVLRQMLRKDRPTDSAPGGQAPLILVVDHETPPVPGVTPAAYPTNIPNNHLGYALTWFGLAIALACVYGAAVWQRRRSR
jgi:surfeit locus 1 family protein